MKIVIVDYGLGNPKSIKNMLKKIGFLADITRDEETILNADKLILPGVGHFLKGMEQLKNLNLIPVLEQKVIKEKTPILGICLGMQLFASRSEEGHVSGLNWVNAEVKKFKPKNKLFKVPNMGWLDISINNNHDLFKDMNASRFYFVHSYYIICMHPDDQIATAMFEEEYTVALSHKNIFGVQFHPEKSHKFGMQLLKNFAQL